MDRNEPRFIVLRNGMSCFVDSEDFEKLNKYKWYALYNKFTRNYYATRTINSGEKKCIVYMHRELVKLKKGYLVDHINHNTLDNRKCNLRSATHSQNQMNSKIRITNTSGFTGVSWISSRNKWSAMIMINKKAINLGRFLLKCQAVKARKEAEIKYFGEYRYNVK